MTIVENAIRSTYTSLDLILVSFFLQLQINSNQMNENETRRKQTNLGIAMHWSLQRWFILHTFAKVKIKVCCAWIFILYILQWLDLGWSTSHLSGHHTRVQTVSSKLWEATFDPIALRKHIRSISCVRRTPYTFYIHWSNNLNSMSLEAYQ